MENQETQLRRTSDKKLTGLINPLFRSVKQSHKSFMYLINIIEKSYVILLWCNINKDNTYSKIGYDRKINWNIIRLEETKTKTLVKFKQKIKDKIKQKLNKN